MSALSTPGHARSRPYAAFALLVLAAMHLQSAAISLQCTIGAARCVKSQGTEIPSKRAIEVLELCDDLNFERKPRAEDAKYEQIKRACAQLERDFNDESKWTK